jgi:signal transduction histidine kinase
MDRPFRPIEMPQVTAILMSIAGQLNFRAVIRAASQEISGHLPHDHVDIALMSPDGQSVTAWETGLHTEWDAETTATKPVDVSPIRRLFRGEVDHIITGDAQNDPRFHFAGAFSTPIFAVGLRSRLHVPLKVEGLRLGARQLAEAMEEARRNIGMDLHDQTVADLSRISRNIRRLADRGGALHSELATLEEEINHCLRELRVIVDDARPSVLELFGFAEAVEALMDRSAAPLMVPVKWQVSDASNGVIDRMPSHT